MRRETNPISKKKKELNNMINYGNSRALVAVVDKLPTVQEDNWPQRGQIIYGKPLSINYNENVFGEMPSQEDTEQESRYSEEKERVQEVFRPKVEEVQNNDGGFFITEDVGIQMQRQKPEQLPELQESQEEATTQEEEPEDFGKWKLNQFKNYARNLLLL